MYILVYTICFWHKLAYTRTYKYMQYIKVYKVYTSMYKNYHSYPGCEDSRSAAKILPLLLLIAYSNWISGSEDQCWHIVASHWVGPIWNLEVSLFSERFAIIAWSNLKGCDFKLPGRNSSTPSWKITIRENHVCIGTYFYSFFFMRRRFLSTFPITGRTR